MKMIGLSAQNESATEITEQKEPCTGTCKTIIQEIKSSTALTKTKTERIALNGSNHNSFWTSIPEDYMALVLKHTVVTLFVGLGKEVTTKKTATNADV